MPTPRPYTDKSGVFLYLLLLTGFFFLLEVSFFVQCNRAYLSDYSFMTHHLAIPLTVLPGIGYFFLAQLVVHLGYCVVFWVLTLSISNLFKLSPSHKIKLAISIWMSGILTLVIANQYFFPNSKFAELSAIFLNHRSARIFLMSGIFFMVVFFFLAIIGSRFLRLLSVVSLMMVMGCFYYVPQKNAPTDMATREKPNIIIIGIDSLRPDFLGYFGHEKNTPFFDTFLEQSTVFSEAVTPLARTFPSWTGILTGEYPRQMGIRSNLVEQRGIDFSATLPAILQHRGYETLYATDETRFSNIDINYGFDQIVTPPMGLNDFLLGTFNDFPLSNILINTPMGQWLFPHSYANRPVFFSYQPDSFIHLIAPYISQKRTKPLFLAIHFCLPHYPYLWAGLSGDQYEPLTRYEKSIHRVDQQVNDFFILLERAHLLNHAIVILLSDHGEALELSGDRITEGELFLSADGHTSPPHFYPPSLDKEAVNQSVGHGTDVLSLTQYHTLLAVRLYGEGEQLRGVIQGAVSLLAIKPTVLDLIDKNPHPLLSHSLAPNILGRTRVIPREHIFLESDFTPEAIRTVYPEMRDVLLEGIELFQIDPKTTRLVVRDTMGKMIINSKQYADIYGDWMLALYPQSQYARMPVLVNLFNGQWTNDLHSSFAQHSPANEMLVALQSFYGNEIH